MTQRNRLGLPGLMLLLATVLGVVGIRCVEAQERIRPAYTADFVAQMLDYVSRDYALAVSNGKVIDEDEYVEQLVISNSALEVGDQVKALAAQPAIRAGIIELISQIKAKAPPEVIKRQALKVRDAIYATTGVATTPARWPSLVRGKQVFDATCASCHGSAGDGRGPAGLKLKPPPANFLDTTRMAMISPLSAFGAIKLGVRSTDMRGFAELSDEDVWAVAFYTVSLRPRGGMPVAGKLDQTAADLWLKAAAELPDGELMQALPGPPAERQKLLALIRSHSEDSKRP